MSYRRRQAVIAALTANALRPVPGYYAGIPAMFGGWLTSELAPHVLAFSAADTLREITRGGRDRHGLALAGLSALGLTALMVQSEGARKHVDAALCEALGDDYLEHLQRTGQVRSTRLVEPAQAPQSLAEREELLERLLHRLRHEVERHVVRRRELVVGDEARRGARR